MLKWMVLLAAFAVCMRAETPPRQEAASECFNAAEKKRLAGQDKIDGRIKVYRGISERYQHAVPGLAAKTRFEEVPALIACWKELLEISLTDIEANINRKKKSGALIDYEIQLRRSIVDMNSIRLRSPAERQDDFESWIAQASRIRQKFVDILFQRGSTESGGGKR